MYCETNDNNDHDHQNALLFLFNIAVMVIFLPEVHSILRYVVKHRNAINNRFLLVRQDMHVYRRRLPIVYNVPS